jgi:hypothetical protein
MYCELKLIKNNNKANISYSISQYPDGTFRSYNFTGKLTSCEGFQSREGINYDKALVEVNCSTTLIITNQAQGAAIVDKLASVFEDRYSVGDKNPAVDLKVECNSVNPTNTNILITNVKKVFVERNTTLANNKQNIEDALSNLRSFSNTRSTISTSPKVNTQLSSARKGLTSVISSIKSYM